MRKPPLYISLGEGNGNPLQCSCLENPRDRGDWWAAVYGVAQSRTRLKRLSSSSSTYLIASSLLLWLLFSRFSHLQLFATPWTGLAGLPVHHQLLEPTQTHVRCVGNVIQPSHPLTSPSPLPSIFPSIRVFSNESALRIRWPKYWSFSFIISPSSEHPGLIFRMDWLDLLAVQGTLKSLLQHHSSKASILQC